MSTVHSYFYLIFAYVSFIQGYFSCQKFRFYEKVNKKRLSHSKTKLISFEGFQQHLYKLQVLLQIQLLAKKKSINQKIRLYLKTEVNKKSLRLFLTQNRNSFCSKGFNLITSLWIESFLLLPQKIFKIFLFLCWWGIEFVVNIRLLEILSVKMIIKFLIKLL